jgi:signal peptidase I
MIHPSALPCTTTAFAGLSADLLRLGKTLRFQARGSSMQPLVRDGDVLLVQPAGSRQVRVGDVILCSSHAEQRVIVHRVVRKRLTPDGMRYWVQGDQVSRPDGLMSDEQIFGQLIAIDRHDLQIDMCHPKLRFLSGLAVLRSRWQFGRQGWPYRTFHWIKRLPAFIHFLY